jgi:hypothetical protein
VDVSALHLFYAQRCLNGILILATSRETVYAELPCDRSLPETALHPFLGQPVRVRFAAGDPSRLFIESQTAGTVEFTVPGIWIETR